MDQHTSVYTVICGYLQPFELAVLTNTHSIESYLNAAACDSVEYLQQYRHVCTDFTLAMQTAATSGALGAIPLLIKYAKITCACWAEEPREYHYCSHTQANTKFLRSALYAAADADQLAAARLIITLGINKNTTFSDAASMGNVKAMQVLFDTGGVTYLDTALYGAAMNNHFDVVHLLAKLGATAWVVALKAAENYNQHEMIVLLTKLKNQQS